MNGFILPRACTAALALGLLLWSGMLRAQDQPQPQQPSVASPPVPPMSPMQPMSGNPSLPANLAIYPEHSCESCGAATHGMYAPGNCGGSGCCCCDPRCPEEVCSCRCPGYEPCFPCWYVEADALIVTRNNASINQPVVLADDTGDTVLTTHDLDFGWNGGVRLFIGKETSKCGGFEIGYLGLYGGTATATATDPNNLDIPSPLGAQTDDFFLADTMTLTYNWNVNNAEFNVFRQFGRIQGLIGFRYFNLHERFDIHAVDSDGNASDYPISTSNNLFGGQLGARTYCQLGKCFRVGATGKAGVFGNNAIEHQAVFDDNNTVTLRSAEGRSGAVSFVTDLNAYASVALSRYWRFRAGYYLLYATNLALAPDQLDFSFNADSGTQVHNDGNLFVHGATFGLEAAW